MQEVPIVNFISGVTVDTLWSGLKAMYLLGLGIYLIFALVMIRQVSLMTQALNGRMDLPLKLVSYIHLAMAIGIWLLALVVL